MKDFTKVIVEAIDIRLMQQVALLNKLHALMVYATIIKDYEGHKKLYTIAEKVSKRKNEEEHFTNEEIDKLYNVIVKEDFENE